MNSDHSGKFLVGGREARLDIEPDQWIRCSLVLPGAIDGDQALNDHYRLAGNLRFAWDRSMTLVADTRLDGQRHLSRSFDDIRKGMNQMSRRMIARAAGQNHGRRSGSAESSERRNRRFRRMDQADEGSESVGALRSAVERIDTARIDVVSIGEGIEESHGENGQSQAWELRPRIQSDVVPVRLEACGKDGARLFRTLRIAVGSDVIRMVADQCLRWNSRLRMCRLSMIDGSVTVESRLHGGQLTARWLSLTATSLAVADHACARLLRSLAREPELDEYYARCFLDRGNSDPTSRAKEGA